MKKSTRKFIRNTTIIVVIVTIIAMFIQQFTFVDPDFYTGVIRCDKETGCTDTELRQCELISDDYQESRSDIVCEDSCVVKCSNTNEMIARSSGYDKPCQEYFGGGALVEAVKKCANIAEPISHAKTICSNGIDHVFTIPHQNSDKYPNWDVYYANEIDVLEEVKTRCEDGCRQVTDTRAECYEDGGINDVVHLDHKECFQIFDSRWEVWWFNSDDQLAERVEICQDICQNAECTTKEVPPTGDGDGDGDGGEPVEKDCGVFLECNADEYYSCADGTEILVYQCKDGCSIPVASLCENGESPIDDTSPIFDCKTYEDLNLQGECTFSFERAITTKGALDFFKDNSILTAIGAGLLLIGFVFIITTNTQKKQGGF